MMSPQSYEGGRTHALRRRQPPRQLSERKIVHRALATVCGLVLAAILPLAAQQQRKPSPGPRALGLLVIPKPPAGPKKVAAKPYLIPIALWYQNRYFDAQLYGARPEPMALDGGVVYEARRGGDALGLFTVDSVAQLESKRWIGGGQYQTMKEIEARAAARREHNKGPTETVKDEGPPRLRRAEKSSSTPAPSSPEPAAPTPTTSTPTASAPAASPAPSQPSPAAKPEAAPQPKTATQSEDEDPDRPRLHRAPTGEPQTIAPNIKPAPASIAPAAKNAPAPAGVPTPTQVVSAPMPDVYVAISDAKTVEPRPYDFTWSAEEKASYTKSIQQMANAAIADFLEKRYHVQPTAASRPAAPSRSHTRAAVPPSAPEPPLENVQVRALDVLTDNYPEIVLTADRAAQVPGPEGGSDQRTVYVTMVVRVDPTAVDRRDQYRTLLSYVTDDRHLDELPKLALVDAVDADGDGIGKLLFRETFSPTDEANPQAWGFQLYRVGVDRLEKLYDTEGKME